MPISWTSILLMIIWTILTFMNIPMPININRSIQKKTKKKDKFFDW